MQVTIPPGGELRLDSDVFLAMLDGENVLYAQSGDWINVSRELLRLIVESATGGDLEGQIYNGKVWEPDSGNLRAMELCKDLADALAVYALSIQDEKQRVAYQAHVGEVAAAHQPGDHLERCGQCSPGKHDRV